MHEMLSLRGRGGGPPGRYQLGQEGSGGRDQFPSPPTSVSSCHDNRASNPVFPRNLHFNGDVIRIKKLRLERTEPSPFPGEPETTPQALP